MPVPDRISRAARFFVLAEQASHLHYLSNEYFWDLSALLVVETAPHLPAMAAAVRRPVDLFWMTLLRSVASHPLPGVLPPEAVRWYERLVAAWEVHRTSSDKDLQNLARLALVRLDGCGIPDREQRLSRLPEWLTEAENIAMGQWRLANGDWKGQPISRTYWHLQALAALAAWRPVPQCITWPETLRAWVDFWLEMRRSTDPVEKGIAAIALLNLPEVDLRAAFIPSLPCQQLLQELAAAIPVAAEKTIHMWQSYLFLLNWQPVTGTAWPVEEVRNVVQAWLEVTRHKEWCPRCDAWRQLIRWDRAGHLALYGLDLLSELVKAVPTENAEWVLWETARWVPAAKCLTLTGTPDSFSRLRKLEKAWERRRASRNLFSRMSAWLAGIRLHQAGLASEPPESFLNAYLSRVVKEKEPEVLSVLAQWFPGTGSPGMRRGWNEAWQQRLLDKNEHIRQIAAWALLHQSMEKEDGRSLRYAALGLWRAGTKASSEASHRLGAVFARFQDVQARLAAGEVVDFEAKPARPAERHHPPLALPPGRIAGREWKMENEKLKMENEGMQHQELTPKSNPRLVPDSASRSGMSE